MRLFTAPLCLAVGLLAMAPSLPARQAATDKDRVARLVAQLGSRRFTEREDATRALDAVGAAALPALRTALRGPDAEVRRRAAELIGRIELRLESERLLKTKRVRLVYKDTPVTEAVADLARQTGLAVRLDGDPRGLRGRRVTLDTGETTPWDALAKLCAGAGLRERAALEPPAPRLGQPIEDIRGGGRRRIVFVDGNSLNRFFQADKPVLLEDGKGARPTARFGAVRFRALPAPAALNPRSTEGQVLVTLEVKPEPHVAWERVVALRITRAVDDQGQVLRPTTTAVGEARAPSLLPEEENNILIVRDNRIGTLGNLGQRQLPVTLQLAGRPSRSLRELSGVVGAYVRTQPEVVATIEDALKIGSRSLRGVDGTVLNVRASQEDEMVRLQIDVVPAAPPVDPLDGLGGRVNVLDRVRMVEGSARTPTGPDNPTLTLFDARGRPIRPVNSHFRENPNDARKTYTFVFLPGKDQPPPARLTYTARRFAFVEVPFTLKDVPLTVK
jgi:hypothetical protein